MWPPLLKPRWVMWFKVGNGKGKCASQLFLVTWKEQLISRSISKRSVPLHCTINLMGKTTNMGFTDNYVIISEHVYSNTDQVWANQNQPLIVPVCALPKVRIWTKLYKTVSAHALQRSLWKTAEQGTCISLLGPWFTDPKIPEYLGTLVEVILSSFNPNYCVCL